MKLFSLLFLTGVMFSYHFSLEIKTNPHGLSNWINYHTLSILSFFCFALLATYLSPGKLKSGSKLVAILALIAFIVLSLVLENLPFSS